MDRHHQIRIAVSHLKGAAREEEIMRLLKNPELLYKVVGLKINMHHWRK